MKIRGFEKIAKYAEVDFPMPERKTELSAGYDFCLPEDVVLEPGKIYTGKVTRLMNFGAFVEILPGKEGLVHISQLSTEHVDKVEDVVSVGDEIVVKVTEIDNKGRINLSRKAVLMKGMQK